MHKHTESAIKRREPSINKLATSYNQLCGQLAALIQKRQAPASAIAPLRIQREGLFTLDVDDDIWQDVGLDDDQSTGIPRWLGDDKVREGIRTLLEYDRCIEEEDRVIHERAAMQEWFMEEWGAVENALLVHSKHLINFLIPDCC